MGGQRLGGGRVGDVPEVDAAGLLDVQGEPVGVDAGLVVLHEGLVAGLVLVDEHVAIAVGAGDGHDLHALAGEVAGVVLHEGVLDLDRVRGVGEVEDVRPTGPRLAGGLAVGVGVGVVAVDVHVGRAAEGAGAVRGPVLDVRVADDGHVLLDGREGLDRRWGRLLPERGGHHARDHEDGRGQNHSRSQLHASSLEKTGRAWPRVDARKPTESSEVVQVGQWARRRSRLPRADGRVGTSTRPRAGGDPAVRRAGRGCPARRRRGPGAGRGGCPRTTRRRCPRPRRRPVTGSTAGRGR